MIFVMPPNRESLRARLEGRDGDAAQQLAKRLAEADGEIAVARDSGCYEHFVVNDVLETTIEQVLEIPERNVDVQRVPLRRLGQTLLRGADRADGRPRQHASSMGNVSRRGGSTGASGEPVPWDQLEARP